jgi:azurin
MKNLIAVCLFAICAVAQAQRVIAITADKDNTFKPKVINLTAGEKVILRITSHFGGEQSSEGYQHSLVIKKVESWDFRFKDGVTDFPAVAPPAGEYKAECTVKCGKGHDDMNMKVIVK